MDIIIPLGGKGERFSKNGYYKPKALIDILDKKMIDYALSFYNNLVEDDRVFIFYNTSLDDHGFKNYINNKYEKIILVPITEQTRGASETIYKGMIYLYDKGLYRNTKTLLLDCDTFYLEDIISIFRNKKIEESNVVFNMLDTNPNPIYSYVSVDNSGVINKIIEKEKISDLANTGAYGFCSTESLKYYCKFVLDNNINFKGEPYISCVIDQMMKNSQFYSVLLDREKVISLGTPEDVVKYCKNAKVYMFDLDGTIVNTDKIYFNVWSKILSKYNVSLTLDMFNKYIHSNNDRNVVSTFLHNVNIDEISKLKDELFISFADQVELISGVYSFIKSVYDKGIKCCVVTNCNYKTAELILKNTNLLKYMDFIISGDIVENGKPNSEPYLKAMERYNINTEQCVVFEDSKSGILSALNSGIKRVIGVQTNYNSDELKNIGACITIQDFNNLEVNIYDRIKIKDNRIFEYIENAMRKHHNIYDNRLNIVYDKSKLKGGFIADVIKFEVYIDGILNESLIAKYENYIDNGLTNMAKKLELYNREYYFYKNICEYTPIHTGRFIEIIRDDNMIENGIILSDLSTIKGQFNLNLNTEHIEVTLKIVDKMAKLHSKFWGKDLQKAFPQLKKTSDITFRPFFQEYINNRFSKFIEIWDNNLNQKQKDIFNYINDNFSDIQLSLSKGSLTFIHGDIKSPNIFYSYDNEKEPCFIDWQHCGIGKGTQDLIFFILESFDITKIKEVYDLCTSYYFIKLIEYGVKYNKEEYNKDIKNSLYYIPFFTSIWFGTTPIDELIDPNWPFFFIQKVAYLCEYIN